MTSRTVPVDSKPVISLSLLRELSQAISHMTPDRAMRVILENAVAATESSGAVLLIPHEKQREMVLLFEHLPEPLPGNFWDPLLAGGLFRLFTEGRTRLLEANHLRDYLGSSADQLSQALAMPLQPAGKPIGMLFLFRGRASTIGFTGEHLDFIDILAPFFGTLIENFRLHNEMLHKNTRLSALYEISQRAESLIDLRDIYDALGKVVKSFIDYDVFMLHLLLGDGQTLENRGSTTGPFPTQVKIGDGPLGQAAKELKPHLTYTDQYKSVLILPIVVSGKLIGVLTIASLKSYAYRYEDIIGLRIIATQIASIDVLFKDLLRLRGFTQHILQSMTSGVLIFDNQGKVTLSNPAMTTLLGQVIPEGWSAAREDGPLPASLRRILLEVIESKTAVENLKVQLSELVPPATIEVNAFPFRDESGLMLGTAFFFKEITQIVRLEDQLKRADRLSALGALAAGIAHEIRNPLTGMKMIVQLLQSDFPEGDPKREPLGLIQNEIDRLERIIVNLLDFARPSKPQAVPFALPQVLDGCLMLLQTQMNKLQLQLRREYPEHLPTIVGDPAQLKQVFLNILTNAIQASRPEGLLTVRIAIESQIVRTSIIDTGIGIPKDKIKAIFDPFMTTKEDGTGLGLPLALRIVEEHGGRIEVESTDGSGSSFSVLLPLPNQPGGAGGHD